LASSSRLAANQIEIIATKNHFVTFTPKFGSHFCIKILQARQWKPYHTIP